VAQAREKAALAAATSARDALQAAEQREAAGRGQGGDSARLQQLEDHVAELQRQVQAGARREEDLGAQVARLQLSEEGLTRLLARAQAVEEDLRRDLTRAAAREESVNQQLAMARMQAAESDSTVEDLHVKISELENALVRMATAEDEAGELRSKVVSATLVLMSGDGP
jgi:chromosome segregation ATPase